MTIQQPPYTAGGAVPPLELPYYGAPPVEAVKRVFQKYAVFSGRASRSEYWWWALASAVASGAPGSGTCSSITVVVPPTMPCTDAMALRAIPVTSTTSEASSSARSTWAAIA